MKQTFHDIFSSIEGFHVTSFEAKFASHHTRDLHVGFLFARLCIGKHNKMSRTFLFSSYQITTEWQEYQHTHSVEIWNPSMK